MEFEKLKKEAENLDESAFLERIKKAKESFELKDLSKVVVIGDLHGDLFTLLKILTKVDLERYSIIFLGDYIDRGRYQIELLNLLLFLKEMYPDRILLLKGNHEFVYKIDVYPHDFPIRLSEIFKGFSKIYKELLELFKCLPFFFNLHNFFLVHGGIPINPEEIELNELDESEEIQFLWNDPFEGKGFFPSPRGIGFLFGKDITERFCKKFGFKLIVRSHEPCNAFKENHNGKVLTVFSSKVYGNKNAGFILIEKNRISRFIV